MQGIFPTIFLVTYDGVAIFCEMDAYLVFSPCYQIDLQKAEASCFLQGFINCRGKLSDRPVMGGIDNVSGIFSQIRSDCSCFLRESAVNDGKIFFFGLVPLFLENVFCPFVFCEDDDPRCVPVEAMDDEDAAGRFGITFAHIIGQDVVGGFFFFRTRCHRQEFGRLIDRDDIAVFINDLYSFQMVFSHGTLVDLAGMFSSEGTPPGFDSARPKAPPFRAQECCGRLE